MTRTAGQSGKAARALAMALATAAAPLALISPLSPAWALSGDPTPLGVPLPAPGTNQPPAGGGIEAAPLPPAQPAPPPVQTLPGQAPAATPLPAPVATPAAAPAPNAAAGDLGADLWQSSEVSRLMGLIPKLPAPVSVPALSDLQRRLLLTNAPSAGAAGPVDPLMPVRADKLHQMGFNDAAVGLTQGTPMPGPMDPQEAVEKALLANDTSGACQQVDGIMGRTQAPDLFFRRAIIFCQIMRDQNDPASLGLDLLRERNDPDPATKDFIALAALANGETKRVPKNVAVPDPLNVALMKTVGMKAPAAIGAAPVVPVGVGGAVMIARDAGRPLPERLGAAETAFRYGLIPAQELGDLYLQLPAGIADPATAIGMGDSVELRAQLYQAAYRGAVPALKARIIDAALKKARQRGDYVNQAQLYAPLARDIAPSRELSWFAPESARLMFVTGQADKGGYWLNTVAANLGVFSRPGEKEGLDLLGRVAGLPGSGDPVAAWATASGTANPRVELLYTLLSGLNQPVASTIAGSFQAAPIIAPGSAAAEVVAAASGKRKGETILLSLIAIGGDKAIAADPATLGSALRSMIDLGLEADARRIAREIAVLAGL
ncbi:hypothetical protein [Dongia sp.]|uniref:hypothetical protein n=1 Tax=Dongia sp. TaxID=1977262 RepID=UPI0035B2E4ED